MSKKVVRLTESQLRLMINRVINEQTAPAAPQQQPTVTPFTVDFGNAFESGDYKMNPKYEETVNDNVEQILNHIKDKNLKDFKIVITPGESKVTNQPPFQEKGSLASARAAELKNYLKPIFQKSLSTQFVIQTNPPIIGKTPWDPNTDKKDDMKYKMEQFVRVSIVLTTQIIPIPTPKPTIPPPQKTEFMISWTLDKRCDRIKYFNTYEEMNVMANKLKAAGYNTSERETRGTIYASVKLQELSNDPPSTFFDGPFFDSCEQKFVGRK